ncbi:MAG: hypothetical protein ABI893_04730 [Polaromonas sp.]|uniref:hypothetical protein n=1 Tax=Polaromonas sp. TaxID=1869339 RepID=UPI003264541A
MSNPADKPAHAGPSYGAPPFGRASPYLSAAALVFVACFVANLDAVSRSFGLDAEGLQAVILFTSFAGSVLGLTARWSQSAFTKNLGAVFGVLNLGLFVAYGVLALLFAHGAK